MPMIAQVLGRKREFLQLAYEEIDWKWKHRAVRPLAQDHTAKI